jgi:P27 family predicted phage terminase small subunit
MRKPQVSYPLLQQTYRTPKPPSHLSQEARRLWRKVVDEWEIDEAGFPILEASLTAWDEMKRAQLILERDGLTSTGRNGEIVTHPVHKILRAARDQFLRGWKQLDLAEPGTPPPRVGRPPKNNKRY